MRRRLLVAILTVGLLISGAVTAFASVNQQPMATAQPNGRVYAIAVSGSTIFLGGSFTSVTDRSGHAQPRAHLAALNAANGDLLSWAPSANGDVYALATYHSTVYAGGAFTSVSGQSRARLAAIDATTGGVSSWNPGADNTVRALAATESTIYAGGDFKHIGSEAHSRVAAISQGGAAVTGFSANVNRSVYALALAPSGERLYVGGKFTSLDGSSRWAYVGALDPGNGRIDTALDAFAGHAPGPVSALAVDANGVYGAGGGAGSAGGALSLWNTNGTLQHDVYVTDGNIQAVTAYGGEVYAGGHFDNYCIGNTGSGKPFICDKAEKRKKLFSVDEASGAVTAWNPAANSAHGVFALATNTVLGAVDAGGDFTSVGGVSQAHFAQFAGSSTPDPSPSPSPTVSASPSPSPTSSGSSAPPGTICGWKQNPTGHFDHIVVIVYENKSASSIYGNTADAPYINSIADQCGRAENMNDLSPVSLANYVAMTSGSVGSNGEITSNRSPKVWPQSQVSLFEHLGTAGRELAESMPGNCYLAGSGDFAVDHTPYQYYTRIQKTLCPQQAVPLNVTSPDLSAKYTMIIPNKVHDMHKTTQTPTVSDRIKAGDQWTASFLPRVLNSPEYQAGNTLVILTWDEAIGSATKVPFIVISPYTPKGAISNTFFNHYSLLKSVQQMLSDPDLLGHAADSNVATIQSDFNLG